MVEKTKEEETAAPKAPEGVDAKGLLKVIESMSADDRGKLAMLLNAKAADAPKVETKHEAPASKETVAAPEAHGDHEHVGEHHDAAPPAPAVHAHAGHAPVFAAGDANRPGAMEGDKKLATFGVVGGLTAGALAASAYGSALIPGFLQNSAIAHGAVGGLNTVGNGLYAASNAIGLGWTGPVAPAALGVLGGLAGLHVLGRGVNWAHRTFINPNAERVTGFARPTWLGAKAITSPIWAPLKGLGWLGRKTIGNAPGAIVNGVKWTGTQVMKTVPWAGKGAGAGALLSLLVPLTGGTLTLPIALTAATVGAGAFAIGSMGYRTWKWLEAKAGTAAAPGHAAPAAAGAHH